MNRTLINKIQYKIRELGEKEFLDISIVDFARKTEVSISTISRYIRQQGFSNYKDYQYYLRNDDFSYARNDYLKNTIANFDKKLEEVFQDIVKARRILTVGFGSSSHAPRELSLGLCQLGFSSAYFTQFQDLLPVFPSTNENDLLIVFSEQARNKETVFLLNQVNNHLLKCWLVGSYKKFARVKNVVILESPSKDVVKTSYQHSIVNQSVFASSLVSYCIAELKLEQYKIKSELLESEWNK